MIPMIKALLVAAGAEVKKVDDVAFYIDVPKGSSLDNAFQREKMLGFITGAGLKHKLRFKIV